MIPVNVIATADDFGLSPNVNQAILQCFDAGYINSTSFLTNTAYFGESVAMIKVHATIKNIGVHVNFAEGSPLTDFTGSPFVNTDNTWNLAETNNKRRFTLTTGLKQAFEREIAAQIERALDAGIDIKHLDSHYHIHTLPCFYQLFIAAAKKYKLKVRLAQSYNEGNFIKYAFRWFSNNKVKANDVNYTDRFETAGYYLAKPNRTKQTIELMLHPALDEEGNLTDHFEGELLTGWISFVNDNKIL